MGEPSSLGGEVSSLVEQAKELQEKAASLISRTSREEEALRQRVASLDSRINSLRTSKHDDKLEEELVRARYVLSEGDAAAFLPSKSNGRFLRMFLGPINVRANRKDVKLKVKEEYNNFRDRTAFLFLVLPTLLLMLRSWIWDGCLPALPVQLYQAWLLYLYTGLALRENILRVNGSDIRPWWIKHHYFAMAMALISLTWEIERGPDCAQKQVVYAYKLSLTQSETFTHLPLQKELFVWIPCIVFSICFLLPFLLYHMIEHEMVMQRGVELFLKWAIMQGVAMILQNRYQRQRLYTRIALGKARRMDVVWGETAGVQGQLLLLCPILFILQGFEAYVGVLLLKTALAGFSSDWQVITCGLLLIIMAVGNFVNTVQTLMTKSRVKAKIRKGKSRQELNQESGDKSL